MLLLAGVCLAADGPRIYVDPHGVMRNSSDNSEVAYYGTNYTLPFAHAYRMVKKSGADFHKIIDRDVYHFKRLGLNAFRLHLWEAELTDAEGNLLDNEHLALLDYLISALENEGIDIIITAQTNFGNGYPEKNIDTGAFTYDFEKCRIHDDPVAQGIQANYLTQLMRHVNPYNGKSYGADPSIIGVEINNEPCHSGTVPEVTRYIDMMSEALRTGGYRGIILYNVSHNPDVTRAYYDAADVQGTTYQWYPDGLVAGHERHGNLLPYVDRYDIPWKDSIPGFDRMARVVYEFDPGDVLVSYLYPAVARTFRREGFQWATQFAYDPTPIAPYNTEYQTHYLNLLYTPSKALSMAVAAEVMREVPRGKDYGSFPTDSVFGNFRLSPSADLSEYVTRKAYMHTNTTSTPVPDLKGLERIAGVGSSPVVEYEGTGAYFFDRLGPSIWRLEVMPDLIQVADPFEKPSPDRPVGWLDYKENPMKVHLPSLGGDFRYKGIDSGNTREGTASDGAVDLYPGVYLLYGRGDEDDALRAMADNGKNLSRFAAPDPSELPVPSVPVAFRHVAPVNTSRGKDLKLAVNAVALSASRIDSITVSPSDVSFWRDDNPSFAMRHTQGDRYEAAVPADFTRRDRFDYQITVHTPEGAVTYPSGSAGHPLDWDYRDYTYYSTGTVEPGQAVELFLPRNNDPSLDISTIPAEWSWRSSVTKPGPDSRASLEIRDNASDDGLLLVSRYVGDVMEGVPAGGGSGDILISLGGDVPEGARVIVVDREGVSHGADLTSGKVERNGKSSLVTIPLSIMGATPTLLAPTPFPTFLSRVAVPDGLESVPDGVSPADMEFVQITVPRHKGSSVSMRIEGIWLVP